MICDYEKKIEKKKKGKEKLVGRILVMKFWWNKEWKK